MGESPLTWPSLQLPWLALYLRAEAQAGSYAMIFLFIRTKRAQPTKGGRGSPLPFYLIYSKSGLYKVTHRVSSKPHSSWHILAILADQVRVRFLYIYTYVYICTHTHIYYTTYVYVLCNIYVYLWCVYIFFHSLSQFLIFSGSITHFKI